MRSLCEGLTPGRRLRPSSFRPDPRNLAVASLFVALGSVYITLGLWRYGLFRAGYDDGIFAQVIAGAIHGFSSTQESDANHLLVHFSPILFLGYPFVRVFGGITGLIVLQATVCAATIFPVWGLASVRLPKPLAFGVTLVASVYPPLSGLAIGDFHELVFTPFLSACLVLAIDRGAWRWVLVTAAAAACVKEDQFVSLAFIGAVLASTSRDDANRRKCGLSIVALAVAFAMFYFAILRPAIDPHFPYWSLHYYQWWWFPPTPNGFVSWNSPLRIEYIIQALGPLAFLPLLSRRYFVFALPGLAEVMLSHEAISFFIGVQYSATWIGYVLCAFVDGAGWIWKRSATVAKLALLVATGVSIWTSEYNSPILPGGAWMQPSAADKMIDYQLRRLPESATIYSREDIFAHLAATHPRASINLSGQEYLVFNLDVDGDSWKSPVIQGLISQQLYRVVLRTSDLVILERTPKEGQLMRASHT